MSNDSVYWMVFSLLLVGSIAFTLGRFFERADRWLQDWDAERRAKKAVLAAREARLSIPRHAVPIRERIAAVGRSISRAVVPSADAQVWR